MTALSTQHSPLLTAENWNRGFLIDSEWMAGVSEEGSEWKAWVVSLLTGSLVAATNYPTPETAYQALNRIPGRSWKFEPSKTCSGEKCGPENCKGESCKIYRAPDSKACL